MLKRGKLNHVVSSERTAREQVRMRIATEVMGELRSIAKARSVSIAYVAESVLHEQLISGREPASLRGIEASIGDLKRELQLTQGDIERLGEALAFYVYQWFCHTTPIPVTQRKAAAVEGKKRYHNYLRILQNRLHSGRSFLGEIAKDPDGAEPAQS